MKTTNVPNITNVITLVILYSIITDIQVNKNSKDYEILSVYAILTLWLTYICLDMSKVWYTTTYETLKHNGSLIFCLLCILSNKINSFTANCNYYFNSFTANCNNTYGHFNYFINCYIHDIHDNYFVDRCYSINRCNYCLMSSCNIYDYLRNIFIGFDHIKNNTEKCIKYFSSRLNIQSFILQVITTYILYKVMSFPNTSIFVCIPSLYLSICSLLILLNNINYEYIRVASYLVGWAYIFISIPYYYIFISIPYYQNNQFKKSIWFEYSSDLVLSVFISLVSLYIPYMYQKLNTRLNNLSNNLNNESDYESDNDKSDNDESDKV